MFDSGKGGAYIAERLRQLLPEHDYIVVDDSKNVPYGTRNQDEITELTDKAIQPLIGKCSIIVIACNTATVAAIEWLRSKYPALKFIGLEPMIKPAVDMTKSGRITILATPYTFQSKRYQDLKDQYAKDVIVDEPATSEWPRLIEDGRIDEVPLFAAIESRIVGSDVMVLACTHYLALIGPLHSAMPGAKILEPSEAIARQIQRVAANL